MDKTIKDYLKLALITALLSFLIWLPFLLKLPNFYGLNFSEGFNAIYRNFDGIEYVTVAKTLYHPEALAVLPQTQSPFYYASHFPLYPLLIATGSVVLGYLKSMIFVTLLFTILSVWAFYKLLTAFKLSDHPFLLSVIFLILPARWLIVHSVGSPEPIFIFFTIEALYFFLKFEDSGKTPLIWYSAIFASFAQLTRSPGILLFIALMVFIHWKLLLEKKTLGFKKAFLNHLRYWPYVLVPISLLIIFAIYAQSLGDFWAYFHSGDNIHLTFPPFQVFNKAQFWVGDIWLEDVVYIFILGFLGGLMLFRKKVTHPLAFFVLTYLAASTLVVHRDISRYTLPIMPFVLIAFEKVLTSKEFKIVLIILVLGIYLYSQNFLIHNIAPIPNLGVFN